MRRLKAWWDKMDKADKWRLAWILVVVFIAVFVWPTPFTIKKDGFGDPLQVWRFTGKPLDPNKSIH